MTRSAPQTFGYSGTPLVKKLGIKTGARLVFVAAPRDFRALLGEMPRPAPVTKDGVVDFAILFVKMKAELANGFAPLRDRLESNGMLWVAWPKKTSGVASDLSEGIVRDFGLAAGLVDVKVCAIDDTWSGLKFVRRLKDR